MKGIPRLRFGLLGCCAVALVAGCQKADADRLQRVAGKAAEKVQVAAGGAQESVLSGWLMMRGSAEEMSPEARVSARLRWDKVLAGSQIRVKVAGSVVELQGTVASDELKQWAVHLAQTTVGIEKVVDALTIAPGP